MEKRNVRWCKAQYLIVSYSSDTWERKGKETTGDGGDGIAYPRRVELLLRDVTEVFEKLLPTFTEEPRFVPTAPLG
jgi:hypothetical protein